MQVKYFEDETIKTKDINFIEQEYIYGVEDSIRAAKFSYSKDGCTYEGLTDGIYKLGTTPIGSGHDNFLNGIIYQFDCWGSLAWRKELDRYHFIDYVSSMSTMHTIIKGTHYYDIHTNDECIKTFEHLIIKYKTMTDKLLYGNSFKEDGTIIPTNKSNEELDKLWLQCIYSVPVGLLLKARFTTNYRQLKTIYAQRKNHKLPEWTIFCKHLENLEHSDWIMQHQQD